MRALVFIGMCVAPAIAAAPSARAENPFDGRWNATLFTKSGPCQQSYRAEVQISAGIIRVPGDSQGALSGRVSPRGQVVVTGSLGPLSGVATGRLSGNSGAGTWRAKIQEGSCSGQWSAQRQ
ncbi:MAG: hypothetical protein JOZ05_18875 [Acetobacteraceae bacterium]|nr:hypothetical protein [Acetobacteraceae bacterium]